MKAQVNLDRIPDELPPLCDTGCHATDCRPMYLIDCDASDGKRLILQVGRETLAGLIEAKRELRSKT